MNSFNFPRTSDKVEAFMRWLQRQVDQGILELETLPRVGTALEQPWTNIYVYDSYKRGVMRATYEMNRQGYTSVPSLTQRGGIEAVLTNPFHIDRVGVLYTRAFSDLKGITDAMDNQISKVLAQGLIDGDNPRLLARKLVATINGVGAGDLGITDTLGRFIPARRRAEMLARTEVIRAHHQANIQEYKNWGVEGVEVIAEFVTAGDDRVCTECAGYHGNQYTLEQAEHMIPVHPMCRCIVIPISKRKL
jgi:SPP1 gp7 family putative phage head morphogenesis protein